jgi:sugar phosphate isomerase/epimerase
MTMTYSLAHLTLGTMPEQTIRAAAAAGWPAVGLRICARRPGELYAGPELLGYPERAHGLRSLAADLGIALSNVSAYQFYPDVTWEQVAPAVQTTQALGIRTIVANGFDPVMDRFVPLFARYCSAAADAGIAVALEFLPYSGVRTLDAALEVLERSGAANAGVLLDALHLDRSGLVPADIARVPSGRVAFAQLCDARRLERRCSDAELLSEARTARLPAGRGELPLFDFLDALPDGTEVEYEVARADLADASPLVKAQAAMADAMRFQQSYAAHRAARTATPAR